MKTLTLILALTGFARGQDAISLKEAVRQSMARSKVMEAAVLSIRVHLAGVREEQIRRSADLPRAPEES